MAFQSFWRSTSPFLDAIGSLLSDLYKLTVIHRPSCREQFFVAGLNNDEPQAKPIIDDGDLPDPDCQYLLTPDFLHSDLIYAFLVLECVWGSAPGSVSEADATQRLDVCPREQPTRRSRGRSFLRIVATNERCMTFAVVVATLQLFLHLTGANVKTLLLPMLSQATGGMSKASMFGDAVLVLANAGGILGSALAARVYGREVMCVIGGVLIIFCQVVIPTAIETHAGLQGGGAGRMPVGYAAATFLLACAASSGCGWSWGAQFWAVPVEGVQSAREAVGAALGFSLGFAQVHYFLLMLRQLKHAAIAYYAVWIWS